MADIGQITLNGITYDIKDAIARGSIAGLESDVAALLSNVGKPDVITNVSEFTNADQSKVYAYLGTTSENYTNGHWYYYKNNAWTDGGVWGSAVAVDAELKTAGAAADAKVTGDFIRRIIDINEDNLFYYTQTETFTRNGLTIRFEEGWMIINGTSTGVVYIPLMGAQTTNDKILPAGTYTRRSYYEGSVSGITVKYGDTNTDQNSWSNGGTITIETPKCLFIRIGSGNTYDNTKLAYGIYATNNAEDLPANYEPHFSANDIVARTIINEAFCDCSYQLFKSGKSSLFYQGVDDSASPNSNEETSEKIVQGICTDGTYIYAFCPMGDYYTGDKSTVLKIDLEGNRISSNLASYGLSHANGATYCSENNRIYVCTLGHRKYRSLNGPDSGGNLVLGYNPDSTEMGIFNVIAVINPETLELDDEIYENGYVNISNKLECLGTTYKETVIWPEEQGEEIIDPTGILGYKEVPITFAGIEYLPKQKQFALLESPHRLSVDGTQSYSGIIFVDLDFNVCGHYQIRLPSDFHRGDFFVYNDILYLTSAQGDCVGLTYDGKFIGNVSVDSVTSQTYFEAECACVVDDNMYYTYSPRSANQSPIMRIEKIPLLPGRRVSIQEVNGNGNFAHI